MSTQRFGIFPENTVLKQWWGARGIFRPYDKHCKLDIPYDRQNYEGERNDSSDFISWINKYFLIELEKHYGELSSEQGKNVKITSDCDRFVGEASCKNSGGYLYIGCWEKI